MAALVASGRSPPNPDLISWQVDSFFSFFMYGMAMALTFSAYHHPHHHHHHTEKKEREEYNLIFPRLSGHEPSANTVEIIFTFHQPPNFRPPISDSTNINCKPLDYYISNPAQCYNANQPGDLHCGLPASCELRAMKDVEVLAINTQC